MTDVRDALQWVRRELPFMKLNCPGLKIDGERVAAIGWSTGGTLAMSLGYTPHSYGLRSPDAILTFYNPTNYDDDCQYPFRFMITWLTHVVRLQNPHLSERCNRLA